MVRREISDFHRVQERRRRQLPRALLVGLLAGLVAVAFRGSLEWLDRLRDRAVEAAHLHPLWYLPQLLALTAFGAGAAVFLVQRYAPETSGSGIPHVKAVLHNVCAMRWGRILVVKFLGGVCGIGAGLVLGREGPTVQMGAAVGVAMVGGWFASTPASGERSSPPDPEQALPRPLTRRSLAWSSCSRKCSAISLPASLRPRCSPPPPLM
jgi:chloride channel protein, CIC family